MPDILTQFIDISMSKCHPPRIRLASAPQSPRYCAALILFVASLTVRMMPPFLVERPRTGGARLVPGYLNLLCYE